MDVEECKNSSPSISEGSAQWRKLAKSVCQVTLILVIWGLLAIPIIVYYLPLPQEIQEQNSSINFNGTQEVLSHFPCRENFFLEQQFNVCVPRCPSWRQDPIIVSVLVDVVVFISYGTGLVAAVAILVISIIRRENMFVFPNILIVYMTSVYLVQNCLYIIPLFDRAKLYCSSENFFETFTHVTPFCIISGMVQVYSTLSLSLWWFMMTAALFWKIYFPFHSQSFQKTDKVRILHIGCGIFGLVIPLVPIIALMSSFAMKIKSDGGSFTSGGMGFTYVRFPPQPCNGNDKAVVFYSIILPTNLLLAVGIMFTVLILWKVHKQLAIFKKTSSRNILRIGCSERKLLLIIFYYIISTVISLTAFANYSHNSNLFQVRLAEYFTCEQFGHDPSNPCDRQQFEEIASSALAILSYVFLGTLPMVNFVFAVNVHDIKDKCFQVRSSQTSTRNIKSAVSATKL